MSRRENNSLYSSDNMLGKWGFSKVFKTYDNVLHKYVALKVIKKGSNDIKEVEIMKMISNSKDPRAMYEIIFIHFI